MRLATVSTNGLHSPNIDSIGFHSKTTFLDYDILIWDPNLLLDEYLETREVRLQANLSDESPYINTVIFNKILEDIQRRDDEIKLMLELGRVIYICLPSPLIVSAPDKETVDLLDYFTSFNLKTSSVRGKNINFRGEEPFLSFWEKTEKYFAYEARLIEIPGKPLFYIKGTELVVGSHLKVGKGHLVFIPVPSSRATSNRDNSIQDALVELAVKLTEQSNPKKLELPQWSNSYFLPDEHDKRKIVLNLEEELIKVRQKIREEQELIAEIESNKILFVGTGKALEIQVNKIFKELGFLTTVGLPGRDDLILDYHGKIAVVEVKGLGKSAAENNAAQLEKWVSEYYLTKGNKPKGILIVNAYRDVPLKNRNDSPFPHQMLEYSTKREHCLITGLQLLCLYLDCKDSNEKKAEIIEHLFATKGIYSEYQDWTKFILKEEKEVATKKL